MCLCCRRHPGGPSRQSLLERRCPVPGRARRPHRDGAPPGDGGLRRGGGSPPEGPVHAVRGAGAAAAPGRGPDGPAERPAERVRGPGASGPTGVPRRQHGRARRHRAQGGRPAADAAVLRAGGHEVGACAEAMTGVHEECISERLYSDNSGRTLLLLRWRESRAKVV